MREAFVKINDGQTLELDSGDIFDNELVYEIIGSSTPLIALCLPILEKRVYF